jgi:hypothetical protein
MTTLTRATLGKLAQRAAKDIVIDGHAVRIQRPTPLEFSQYQVGLMNADGKMDVSKLADAVLLLVARMWIDDGGNRLFRDNEIKELGTIDLSFYQKLSVECQKFASGEASDVLGESEETTDLDLHVESA